MCCAVTGASNFRNILLLMGTKICSKELPDSELKNLEPKQAKANLTRPFCLKEAASTCVSPTPIACYHAYDIGLISGLTEQCQSRNHLLRQSYGTKKIILGSSIVFFSGKFITSWKSGLGLKPFFSLILALQTGSSNKSEWEIVSFYYFAAAWVKLGYRLALKALIWSKLYWSIVYAWL